MIMASASHFVTLDLAADLAVTNGRPSALI
jgi:hypothetical protein